MWALAGSLSGLWGGLFLTLWERAPTPERARRLHRGTVAGVGAVQDPAHRGGGGGCAAASPGGRPGSDRWGGAIGMLVAQLRLVHEQVKALDRGIAALLQQLPAALGEADEEADGGDSLTRLLSMKGAGPVVAAGLFGEAGDLLVEGSLGQTRAYLGAAPVTRKSGGKETHHKRRAVNRGRTRSTTSRWPPSPPIPASSDKRRSSRPVGTTTILRTSCFFASSATRPSTTERTLQKAAAA